MPKENRKDKRASECSMLGLTLKDELRNEVFCQRSKNFQGKGLAISVKGQKTVKANES